MIYMFLTKNGLPLGTSWKKIQIYLNTSSSFIISKNLKIILVTRLIIGGSRAKFPKLNAKFQDKLFTQSILYGDEFYLIMIHASCQTVITDLSSLC